MEEKTKEYKIWIEGYAATGQHSPASFIGKAEGKDFADACENFRYPKDVIREWDGKVLVKKGTSLSLDEHYDEPSIWACRLFDNEAAARKSFG